MPHIFFERLEHRRSTQALLGNISINGLSGFSSFSSSAQYNISGSYGFPLGAGGSWSGVIFDTSKLSTWKSPTQQSWLNPSYQSPSWNYLNNWTSPIQQPWLTPSSWTSTQFPTSNWTYPLSQKYPISLGLGGSGLSGSDLGEGGLGFLGGGLGTGGGLGGYGTGSIGGGYGPGWIGLCCYAYGGMAGFGGMSSLGGMSGFSGGISKLEKVRKNLLAFFQNKGILTDKQRQRLLSSPFDKA